MATQAGQAIQDRNKRISRLALILILLVSALIQLTVVSRTRVIDPIRADASVYFTYAYNLTHFGVYSRANTWDKEKAKQPLLPDAQTTPGYPLFLAAVGTPEPNSSYVLRVTVAQAGLGVLSVWLIYLISARFLGRGWSHAVALLTALSPHMATISTYLLTESLFVILLFAAVYGSIVAFEARRPWQFVLAGVLWGLCGFVRPTMQLLPVLMLLAVWIVPRLRPLALATTIGFICFVAVQMPWVIRNQSVPVDKSQPSLAAKFLQHGSYPNFMYEGRKASYGYPYMYDPDSDRIGRDIPSALKQIAKHFRDEPITYTYWYLIGKPVFLLTWSDMSGIGDVYYYPIASTPYIEDARFVAIRKMINFLHWPLMVFGLVGALIVCGKPRWLALDPSEQLAAVVVAIIVLYAIAFHMVGAPFPRYGIPFRPLLYALAMMSASGIWMRLRHGAAQRDEAPSTTESPNNN